MNRSGSLATSVAVALFIIWPVGRVATAQTVTWVGSGSNTSWTATPNWSGTWASGTATHLVIGTGFTSGTTLWNNVSSYAQGTFSGARIGSLTLSSATPFAVNGGMVFLNGPIRSSGSAARSVIAPITLQQPSTDIEVARGSGLLTLGTIYTSTGASVSLRKTGGGELALNGSFLTAGPQLTTFTLQDGVVTLGGSLRQGFVAGSSSPLGPIGSGSFSSGVLRLEGGTLRSIATGTGSLPAQYYTFAVLQDTILSGTAALGDPAGQANARMTFINGFRLERDSQLVVHNDTTLNRAISGSYALTVTGGGRLNLGATPLVSGSALGRLIVDGGGVGISGSAALPADGITLRNGGRLDSLTGYTLPAGRRITIEGDGVLRSASPNAFADMIIGSSQVVGSGTLRIESTQPVLPPTMDAGYYIQPGRIRITGSNMGFTGSTVVNGGELVVSHQRGLGLTFVSGGTQAVTVNAGILTLSGSGMTSTPDLTRVAVNRGGTLKFAAGANVVLTATTAPATPIAGMVGLEFATLSGSGAGLRVADGAIIQNSGTATAPATLACNVVYSSADAGTVTLAGTYIPNRRFTWGGELNVSGQLQRAEGAGPFNLVIRGAGVNMGVSQATFSGSTTIDNGRLSLTSPVALGQLSTGRSVHIKPGAQLDLASGTFSSLAMVPAITGSSAGMIGFAASVPNDVVRTLARGQNAIGPAYYQDYVYASNQPLDAVNGVYRFGTVSTGSTFGTTWQVPRAFAITQPNVLTGSASLIVGGPRGDAFGAASSVLRIGANQDFTGGATVRKDFFLGVDQSLASPFGTGTVTIAGRLLATGSNGSFAGLANPSQITFAKGGELWLDNSVGVNHDRWGDTASIAIDAGAVRLSGRVGVAVSETVGTLSYSGGSRIYLDNLTSGSTTTTTLTIKSLAPTGPHATLDISEAYGPERLFVTEAPPTIGSGSVKLLPGVIDRRTQAFVTRSSTTGELVAANPNVSSLTAANSQAYVGLSTTVTASTSVSMLALRTMAPILATGTGVTLTIGDGTTAQLMAVHSGSAEIRPNLVFNGEGIVYTGSNARTVFAGVVTATSGIVKLGPGDLVLSNTMSLAGAAMQDLRVREGRVGGNGSRMWNVIVEGSGVFAPGNSPAVMETGGLQMSADTATEMELSSLDAVSDRIDVAGNITLDGFIDVVDWEVDGVGTMEVGTYDLMTWGGSYTDNGISLRSMPEGFDGYLNLDTQNRVLQLVVVPEPASVVLGLLAACGAAAIHRRHRRRRAEISSSR